jgi:DNA topoisomerase I
MGKTLIISEKPSVTRELMQSQRFKNSQRKQGTKPFYGYFENETYINTWAIGHLLELYNPEDHNPEYKEFRFDNLPLLLEPKYKIKNETKEQLLIIKELLERNDVSTVINACDCDMEGQLIFDEIIEFLGIQNKKILRLILSSYESSEIEAALNGLRPGEEFRFIGKSAKARQYLDHTVGDTLTRSSTSKLANNHFLLSGGRVQTVILNEINKREREIENFKPQTFYTFTADVGFLAQLQTEEEYILEPKTFEELKEKIKGNSLTVSSFDEKTSSRNPKNLYNLTDLYKDAINKLKISSPKAKKIIQDLYENGFISYPRSDSRHLPTTMVETVKEVAQTLLLTAEFEGLDNLDVNNITLKHRSFNDELVTSHYAIIPTKKKYVKENRPELEKQIYNLISSRFIAHWMHPAKYLVREIHLVDPFENKYISKEKVLIDKGYLTLLADEIEDEIKKEFKIPSTNTGSVFPVNDSFINTGQTRRASYHSEASILTFMETAGRNLIEDEELKELMKGKRIGTVATEETFIPKLTERGYVKLEKNRIATTSLGRAFIESLPVEEIKDPLFTAEMEYSIQQIQNENLNYETFIETVNQFAHTIVNKMKDVSPAVSKTIEQSRNKDILVCKCKCGNSLIDKGKFYGCSNYPHCNLSVPKIIKGVTISIPQVQKLFKDGKTELIKGFKSNDKEFDAYIILKDSKIEFLFPTIKELSIASCPKCTKGYILPREKSYGCSEYKNGCTFSLPKTIKSKKISESQMKKLIQNKTTDFIQGFQGDKGDFIAALQLKPDFSLVMVFPKTEDLTLGKCPKCKKGEMLPKQTFYGCSEYKNGCDFSLPSSIKEKNISPSQITKLIKSKTTDFINGFKSSKGEFTAAIILTNELELKFKFPTTDDKTIGKCPLCKARVLIGKTSYLCEHYKKTCDFIIPGKFLEKSVTINHIQKILEKNLTDVIKGFKSSSGKEFDARLSYNNQEKKLMFVFEKKKNKG